MHPTHTKQSPSFNQYYMNSPAHAPLIKLIDTSFQQPVESPKHLVIDTYTKFNSKGSNTSSPTLTQKSTHAHTLNSYGNSPLSLPQVDPKNSSISLYHTLKEKHKGTFATSPDSPISLKGSSPGGSESPKKAIRIVMASKDFSNSSTNLPTDSNLSPRKRLAIQDAKGTARKKTVKDILIRSNSITSKVTKVPVSQSSSPKRGAMQTRGERSADRLNTSTHKTEPMADVIADLAVAKKIHEKCEKGFSTKIDIYNRFYKTYLVDPEQEYNTKGDLKVKIEPIVPPNPDALQSIKTLRTMKTMKTIKTMKTMKTLHGDQLGFSPTKAMEEYGGFGSYMDKAFGRTMTKTDMSPTKTKLSKLQSMNTLADLGLFDLQDAGPKANTIDNLFSEGVKLAENATKDLKSVQNLMQGSENLKADEERFLTKIKDGSLYAVEEMLKNNPDLILIKDGRNQTPLHWAVKRGHLHVVELLCKYEANIDAVDMVGRTPMDIAKRFGEFQMVQILEFGKEGQDVRIRLRKRESSITKS